MTDRIPVIDLFAGPGGMGEGFAALEPEDPRFRVALSIEMDPVAHRTLELRAFFRQFLPPDVPEDYYKHLRSPTDVDRDELFARHPVAARAARAEAWNAELGVVDDADVDRRIRTALGGAKTWALIGGPPCQAYSLVGRSRRGGIDAKDHRVHLYREYLRIIAQHTPPIFVMENVKGLLSAKVEGQSVFAKMLADLSQPEQAISGKSSPGVEYQILSLVSSQTNLFGESPLDPREYVIACEKYGIPQARHRVILLGVRSDLKLQVPHTLKPSDPICVRDVLHGLPRLRSGLSKVEDSADNWKDAWDAIDLRHDRRAYQPTA